MIYPTDQDAITAVLALYDQARWTSDFAQVEPPVRDDGVCWGLKRFPECDMIVFRGSQTREDWVRDFMAAAHPVRDLPGLGPVEDGFFAGMQAAAAAAAPLLRPLPLCIVGHSLGAAHAWLFAGMTLIGGKSDIRVVAFGSPRPGFRKLAALLANVSVASYCNGPDPVCHAPFHIPPLFPYVEPAAFTEIEVRPDPSDRWKGWAAYHRERYYALGLGVIP
jgi:hypothetical protein